MAESGRVDDQEHSAPTGEPNNNSELMQTGPDGSVKLMAENEPLDVSTLDSIGMNIDALQNFVKRFASIATENDATMDLLKRLALERLERAKLVDSISGYVKYSDHPLGVIPNEDNIVEGAVIRIERYEDHETFWTASLYVRDHLVDRLEKVRDFLNDITTRRLYVAGAPGCGKTCFFWILAGILMKQNKRVLFIQYRVQNDCQIWVLEDGIRKRLTWPPLTFNSLEKVANDLLQTQTRNFDVCICDGVLSNEETCKSLLALLKKWTGKLEEHWISKSIQVTSLQYKTSAGDRGAGDVYMMIDSWREDDYEKAVLEDDGPGRAILLQDWQHLTSSKEVNDLTPNDKDKLLEAVRLKYEFAGGCARYMFDKTVEELMEYLDTTCGSVPTWSAFARTSIPSSTSDAVNSLMQQFSIGGSTRTAMCTPVSKYVLDKAYAECRDQLTAAIEKVAAATNNNSLLGWANELGQKDVMRSVLNANLAAQKVTSRARKASRKRPKAYRINLVKGLKNSLLAFFPCSRG